MHDHEPDEELAFSAKRLEAFKREGELALEIVQDFLAFFQLEHSLAVLRAEASVVAETDKRLADEFEALGLQSQGKSPLVIQLLHQQQQPKTTATSALAREGSMLLDDRQAREWLSSSSSSHHSGREEAPSDKADERAFEVASLEKLSSERLASATGSSRFDIETHNTPQRLSEDRSTAASVATKRGESDNDIKKKLLEKDEDGDDEEEEAKDESIASASELDESIAEEQSASLTYSQDYESASRDDTSDVDDRRHSSAPSGAAAERSSAAPTIQLDKRDDSDRDDKQEHPDDDDGSDKEEDSEPAVLAPPPVPTLLSPLPSLNAPRSRAIDAQHDDDDFDEVCHGVIGIKQSTCLPVVLVCLGASHVVCLLQEREAARLSSLDAKLKAMEAEDETGTLQQLKASLQMELQHDDESVAAKRDAGAVEAAATVAATASRDHDDDHDGYGSDFEEEEVIRYRLEACVHRSAASCCLEQRLSGLWLLRRALSSVRSRTTKRSSRSRICP